MKKNKIIEIIVSIALGMFIVSFGLVLTAYNRGVYQESLANWTQINNISSLEATLIFDEIAQDFCNVSRGDFEGNYTLNESNRLALLDMQAAYKSQLVIAVISFVVIVYGVVSLYKRRRFNWIINGSVLAILFTAINTIYLSVSKSEVIISIKNMIFEMKYTPFFCEGDDLLTIIPREFARDLSLHYLFIIGIMVLIAVIIRLFIIYCGRPHRF